DQVVVPLLTTRMRTLAVAPGFIAAGTLLSDGRISTPLTASADAASSNSTAPIALSSQRPSRLRYTTCASMVSPILVCVKALRGSLRRPIRHVTVLKDNGVEGRQPCNTNKGLRAEDACDASWFRADRRGPRAPEAILPSAARRAEMPPAYPRS